MRHFMSRLPGKVGLGFALLYLCPFYSRARQSKLKLGPWFFGGGRLYRHKPRFTSRLNIAIPVLAFVVAGVFYFLYVRGREHPFSVFLYALLWAICGLACGRFLRRASHWPTLNTLSRSDYSKVWDALSTTAQGAAEAAAGYSN